MTAPEFRPRTLENRKGRPLASRWYAPRGEPLGAVLIAPAIGVPQRFYRDFASWLAERGYLTVTFDYLGIGESLPGSLRALDVNVSDWGRDDGSAVLDAVAAAAGDLLQAPDEVLLFGDDDRLGAQLAQVRAVLSGVAGGDHPRAQRLAELHGSRPGAVIGLGDQYVLAGFQLRQIDQREIADQHRHVMDRRLAGIEHVRVMHQRLLRQQHLLPTDPGEKPGRP